MKNDVWKRSECIKGRTQIVFFIFIVSNKSNIFNITDISAKLYLNKITANCLFFIKT